MTGRRLTENGEDFNNLIQSPEITSTTSSPLDLLRIRCLSGGVFPQPRRSYRELPSTPAVQMFPNLSEIIPSNPREDREPNEPQNRIEKKGNLESLSTKAAAISVGLLFLISISALFAVYMNFPKVTDEERTHIKIPWNIEEAKKLGIVLDKYKKDNYFEVLTGVFITYIFLQTFAIPGSLFLSILSGFLFPFIYALLLVCICSALGASLCFLLSQLLGRRLVLKYFPEKAEKWAVIVNKHKDNLFNYMVFLRVTPFLPNWFINLTAPVIGVPLVPFTLGTFFGVAPPSFVAIQTGQTLYQMSANDTAFSWTSLVLLFVFAVVSLVPIFLKKKLKEKFE